MGVLNWDGLSHYDFKLKAKITEWLNGKAEKVHTHTKSEAGLDKVDNTSDADKPISTAQKKKFDEIDTAIAGKSPTGHTHTKSDITDFPTLGTASAKDVASTGNASATQVVMGNDTRLTDARKASDVPAWAKASTKPTYTASEVGLGNVGNFKAVSTVGSQGLTDTEKSNARANIGAQVAGSYASSTHNHDDRYYTESEIDSKLNGKANSSHGNHVPTTQIADNATFLRNDNTWAKVTPSNIGAQPAGSYASASHTHDDRYYTETEINTKLNGKANSSHTHGNGDITSLDASKITSGTIDLARLPQGALDRLMKVADDTARFKLTTKDVQLGDTVKVTSTKKMYIVVDETKLSSEAGYEPYTADSATSVPWSGVTGKPSTYTPSSHTHDDRYYTESEMNTKLASKSDTTHTHSQYLTSHQDISGKLDKSGGTITGRIVKQTGGSWIGDRDRVVVYSAYPGDNSYGCVACMPTKHATWSIGNLGGEEKLIFNYATDVNYNANKNETAQVSLRPVAGTIALTSDIPTSLPANGGNSSTVNGHTVNSNVPANAKFTDTHTDPVLTKTASTTVGAMWYE